MSARTTLAFTRTQMEYLVEAIEEDIDYGFLTEDGLERAEALRSRFQKKLDKLNHEGESNDDQQE